MTRQNWRLRAEQSKQTVVAFIITKAMTRHINVGVLQTQTMFEELKQTCRLVQEGMGQVLLHASARGRFATPKEIFTEEMQIRLRRAMNAWRTRRQPPIITHDLADEVGDPVLKHLRHRGLFNAAEDPVKIVYHPDFMTATSPLMHLDYIEFVRGCHMGIFPSYYEPWGYTPMESIALGVPAVTTDLSGFGAYVKSKPEEFADQGIFIAGRRGRSFDDCCNDIVEYLYQFTRNDRRKRIEMRNSVERLGAKFDWSALIKHYDKAHAEALSRVGKSVGKVEVRVV
jgi:glycogen(starch) synthase